MRRYVLYIMRVSGKRVLVIVIMAVLVSSVVAGAMSYLTGPLQQQVQLIIIKYYLMNESTM